MSLGQEWRDIAGYEGLYRVSSMGEVYSARGGGRLLNTNNLINGYPRVSLSRKGIIKSFFVHRLVGEAFIGPSNGLQIDHKDGVKTNNNLSNLEWVTPKENCKRAVSMFGIMGDNHGCSKANTFQALTIMTLKASRKMNYRQISAFYNLEETTIGKICRGVSWKHLKLGDYKKHSAIQALKEIEEVLKNV